MIQQENFQNIARLTYKVCEAVHSRPPQVARPPYTSNVSKCLRGLRRGEVWCGVWTGHKCHHADVLLLSGRTSELTAVSVPNETRWQKWY